MDTASLPALPAAAAVIGLLMQFILKPLLELFLQPGSPRHDPVIRAIVLLLGILAVGLNSGLPSLGPAIWEFLLLGAGTGFMAIGGYQAATGSATPHNVTVVGGPLRTPTALSITPIVPPTV